MEFNDLRTDNSIEENGVWRPCGNGEILVASKDSDRWRKALQKALKPHETSITLGIVKEEQARAAIIEAMADGLLLDWKGFTENGVPCPYSRENAIRLLTEVRQFRDFVEREAGNIDAFRKKKEEAEIKN